MHYNGEDRVLDLLERLVAFPSVSDASYIRLNDFIVQYLKDKADHIVYDTAQADGNRNIFVRIGPDKPGGLMLAGHLDVVNVEEKEWETPPFILTRKGDRLYGRGTTDMKGYLACMLALAAEHAEHNAALKKPLYLCFTHTEETNMSGAADLGSFLKKNAILPELCLVGEPTSLHPVTGHKGVCDVKIKARGTAIHASQAPFGINAANLLARFICGIEDLAKNYALNPKRDSSFKPPFSSFNIGTIRAGNAVNTVAPYGEIMMEYRAHPGDNAQKIFSEIRECAKKIGNLTLSIETDVPSFAAKRTGHIMQTLWPEAPCRNVSFCTEAGFYEKAGIPTLVWGPGSIEQAHQSNEYIEVAQLFECFQTLGNIKEKLCCM